MSSDEDSFVNRKFRTAVERIKAAKTAARDKVPQADSNVDLSRPLSSITGRPSIHKLDCSGNCKSSLNHSNDSSEMVSRRSQSHRQLNASECSLKEESRDEVDKAVRTHPQKGRNKPKSCPTTPLPSLNKSPIKTTPPQNRITPEIRETNWNLLYKNSSNSMPASHSPNSKFESNSLNSKTEYKSPAELKFVLQNQSKEQHAMLPVFTYFIVALVAMFLAYYYIGRTTVKNTIPQTHTTESEVSRCFQYFRSNLVGFRERYNVNSYTMSFLQNVVEQIWNDSSTTGFVFVYGRQCEETIDDAKAFTFVSDYAKIVAKFMRNHTNKLIQHIDVNGDDLRMPTKGELIMKYETELNNHGVLLLRKLETLSDTLAQDLHYYCDEITPLVPKSVILFTINMQSCGGCEMAGKKYPTEEKPKQSVKKCLSSKWKKLQSHVLTPLLTRVLNIVIDLDPILFR